ncbi:MAG: flavodoxin [Treponema sp.]|nr:flavodoxin [Treponema sp.]
MKTAVIFYSLDGNCTFVAEEIKNRLNADMIQLRTKDEKKRGKIGKLFWGCIMVFSGKKPPLKPYSFDSSIYELLIIGAPVWADSPAPPVKTFISETGISGKKIALFVCHGGGKGGSQEKFKALLAGNEIIAEADFHEPVKKNKDEVKRQIEDWVKSFN